MEGQLTCLTENTEQYIKFPVLTEKEVTKIDKSGKEITRSMYYRSQLIDSTRSMATSLSNNANNLAGGIHKIKCKYGHDDENVELAELNANISNIFLNK